MRCFEDVVLRNGDGSEVCVAETFLFSRLKDIVRESHTPHAY
jgi:hypothetical protein